MNRLIFLVLIALNVTSIFASKYLVYRARMKIGFYPTASASQRSIGWLDEGDYIYAQGYSPDGKWVLYYDGWVQKNALSQVGITNKKPNCKTNAPLNFRTGPSTSYFRLDLLPIGTEVVRYGYDWRNQDWAITDYGYCNNQYLTC